MDSPVVPRRAETEAHVRLKRLALLWAQTNRYTACAAEVSLPQCRYRADVAAYRSRVREQTVTAIFECKQALPDLRRDNCESVVTRERLLSLSRRRERERRRSRVTTLSQLSRRRSGSACLHSKIAVTVCSRTRDR